MGRIVVKTNVRASAARCFDLARDVVVHCRTSAFTAEEVQPRGRTSGRLELGDTVTFVGRHFGLRWRLTASIVEMERPHRFVDEATGRAFRWLHHVHEFVERDGVTEMIDTLRVAVARGSAWKNRRLAAHRTTHGVVCDHEAAGFEDPRGKR